MGEPESLGSLFKAFIEEVEPKLRAAAEKVERAAKPAHPVSAFDIQEARARIRKYWGGYHPEKPDVIDFALQALEFQNGAALDWKAKFRAQQEVNSRQIEELKVVAGERDRARSDWKDAELRASGLQDVVNEREAAIAQCNTLRAEIEKMVGEQTLKSELVDETIDKADNEVIRLRSAYQNAARERDSMRTHRDRSDEAAAEMRHHRDAVLIEVKNLKGELREVKDLKGELRELDLIIDSFKFVENAPGNPTANKLLRLRDEYRRLEGLIAHVHSVTVNAPTRPDNGSHAHGHPMATEKT